MAWRQTRKAACLPIFCSGGTLVALLNRRGSTVFNLSRGPLLKMWLFRGLGSQALISRGMSSQLGALSARFSEIATRRPGRAAYGWRSTASPPPTTSDSPMAACLTFCLEIVSSSPSRLCGCRGTRPESKAGESSAHRRATLGR
jgi:hypothetical protein